MYIVWSCENVLGCWLPYWDKNVNLCIRDLEFILYATVMLLRFYRCQDFTKS